MSRHYYGRQLSHEEKIRMITFLLSRSELLTEGLSVWQDMAAAKVHDSKI